MNTDPKDPKGLCGGGDPDAPLINSSFRNSIKGICTSFSFVCAILLADGHFFNCSPKSGQGFSFFFFSFYVM